MVRVVGLVSVAAVNEPFVGLNQNAIPAPGVVDVWWFEFASLADFEPVALGHLDPHERSRAAQLKMLEQRRRFIAYRFALRATLASYAGVSPGEIPVAIAPGGKPWWQHAVRGIHVSFNHSHTSRLAVVAVAAEGEVGIDIEEEDAAFNYASLAGEALSPPEQDEFRQLATSAQAAYLLQRWTLKEALFKGLTKGLAIAPAAVTMKIPEAQPPHCVWHVPPETTDPWQLASWSPMAYCYAAVAYGGPGELTIQERDGQTVVAPWRHPK